MTTMEHYDLMSRVRGRNYARDIAIPRRECVGENRVISCLVPELGALITVR